MSGSRTALGCPKGVTGGTRGFRNGKRSYIQKDSSLYENKKTVPNHIGTVFCRGGF
jgi:hypothetical protein